MNYIKYIGVILILGFAMSCSSPDMVTPPDVVIKPVRPGSMDEDPNQADIIHDIDLNNWKVTLPVGDPTEVEPPEILDYANDPVLKEFMYDDSTDGSLVFYTYPGSSTANSSYSRTELREQLVPGSNSVNWTFPQGGVMRGTLKMDEISKDSGGKHHRTIIMQIHGRLTNAQKALIGQKDNNAPPVLKIYWNDNRVRVLRKVLKSTSVDDLAILDKEAWTDEGHWFDQEVGFGKFDLEIRASDGKLEVSLNDNETLVFDDIHMQKWSVFENYFKAGNYLQTEDANSFARIKYYSLEVEH